MYLKFTIYTQTSTICQDKCKSVILLVCLPLLNISESIRRVVVTQGVEQVISQDVFLMKRSHRTGTIEPRETARAATDTQETHT